MSFLVACMKNGQLSFIVGSCALEIINNPETLLDAIGLNSCAHVYFNIV